IGDPDGVTNLKYWLYDHMEGSQYGGLANFYTDYYNYNFLPDTTPEGGKCVVTQWGPGTGHSMTIIGWNDSIRFDYNNDGLYTNNIDINGDQVVDMKDWEIGGFKFINSFGEDWADSSFCYMMYKTVADEKQDGGIWNKSAYIIDIKEDYGPLLTFKIKLKHTARNIIKVRGGVSSDTTDVWPSYTHEFDIFNYQGGAHYMQGIDTIEAHKTIEFGLDVTPLLSYVTPDQPAKFFLQVYEYDPDFSAAGKIINFSIIDYLNGGLEITCPETDVVINNNGYTTLSVIHTMDPELVSIETEGLPAFTANQPLNFQMEASGGNPSYTWNILSLYNESQFPGDFPLIEDEELIPQGGSSSAKVLKDIEFEFPFYGENYTTLTIHTDGILGFRDESLPLPYQVNLLYLFRYAPFVSPFYNTDLQYNQSQNDKIWYSGNENFAAFRWDVTLNIANSLISTDFCVVLYPDGKIEYYYKDFETMSGSEWLTGISAGDGTNYQLSEYSQTLIKGVHVIRYQPQNLLPSYEMSPEGLLTALPTNDQTIYNLSVKVSDDNWITSTRHYQLSSGLIFDYTINSGGDDQVDYGETAFLDLTIKNISSSPISNIVFTTESGDPYITFNDYAENIGTINPGQTVAFANAISFTVSSQVPDNYYLPFEVLITSATNTWEGQFAIRAHAPAIQMGIPYVINTEEGWLNPGETGNIIVPVTNLGHSTANEVSGTIGSGSSYISFNTPTTSYFGDLTKGMTFYDTVNITIDEDCPQGINIGFNYEIEANPNLVIVDSFGLVIGRYPVLLIDMDPELASGPIIKNLLEELEVYYYYANFIPDNLAQYQNLVVILGRKFQNYVLTPSDGELFANFLLAGDNIYMEGGLTWAEDPITLVHPMFNINAISVTWSATDPLVGVNNTFTENMEFNFDGALSVYNNYLIPAAPAFSILKKEENDHVFTIAYDGGSYKTVGSNIDLGGLVDGEHPSTKKNLLAKILIFFGQDIIFTNMVDADIYDIHNLNCYPNPLTTHTTLSFYLPQKDNVDLSIYNMQGQRVLTIVAQDNLTAGEHNYKLKGNLLPQGIYHLILTTKTAKSSIKLVMIN
ncbi:MAG: T9SS type A sorting domain-containing protein, partial [Bacteroidales bacterium]|nr:T9SS type A sorting domain-containing protein [Bacteroidales bacterium]